MAKVKVIVLRTAGTNCDWETAYAFKEAGAETEIIHINKLLRNEVKLIEYHILALPGGFSYGDDISAGKILANKLQYKLQNEIVPFSRSGRFIIGICNGFQILVKAGLLPFNEGEQKVTLTYNDSGKFECRWVYLKRPQNIGNNFWLNDLPEVIHLPVAHGEGKFYSDATTLLQIKKNNLIALQYSDENGDENDYPKNPNGALESIAGITNQERNIFGLMPHPERFVIKQQSPFWTREKNVVPYGYYIIRNVVNEAKKI